MIGQIIGEVLKQLDENRFIVKVPLTHAHDVSTCRLCVGGGGEIHLVLFHLFQASSGPRYVVGCKTKIDKSKLVPGIRVALDMTTLTIMRQLPREVRRTLST